MKCLLIIMLCIVAQAHATNISSLFFDNELTEENCASAGTRNCKKCSKPRCGGCTRR